ncbi:hypothetical protein NXS19_013752 [Fusarium pseudograminearum]|nr:hypothetical protein NXS19_013752 [Fusarium pseudograminearum]
MLASKASRGPAGKILRAGGYIYSLPVDGNNKADTIFGTDIVKLKSIYSKLAHNYLVMFACTSDLLDVTSLVGNLKAGL